MNYYIRPPPLYLPAFTFDIELLNRNSYIYILICINIYFMIKAGV